MGEDDRIRLAPGFKYLLKDGHHVERVEESVSFDLPTLTIALIKLLVHRISAFRNQKDDVSFSRRLPRPMVSRFLSSN